MTTRDHADEARVLILMPTGRDATLTVQLLSEVNLRGDICPDLSTLCQQIRRGASVVLLTEDVFVRDTAGRLAEALRGQPSWSAIPFVMLARESSNQHLTRMATDQLTNVIVVERPARARTLLSVVLSALRGRQHQLEIRDAIEARDRQTAALLMQDRALKQSQIELAHQADQLRAADLRKDEFLATLAHELRNPLAPLRTGLEIISASPKTAALSPTLSVMQRQLAHMVRLIDDLLDVSRITQGRLELMRERVSLNQVIETAIEASRPLIQEGRHHLHSNLPTEPFWLDADHTRVAQVINNLLNNASKYTSPGGMIELNARGDGDCVVIEVRDNGIGIPQSRLEDVFTMFSQVNRTLDRTQGGLGIGLALVRRLVELHGGTVTAHSDGLGLGSTFTVRLPRLVTAAAAASPVQELLDDPVDAKHVLVVDDNQDAAELLSMMLELRGHQARVANSGLDALAAAEESAPQAVILDIGMPGMNGYEVARRMRNDSRYSHTALIALTGWGSLEDKRRASDAGFDFHLTKPVNEHELQRILMLISDNFVPARPLASCGAS